MAYTSDSSGYINREATGYVVNCLLSPKNQAQVAEVQEKLKNKFGHKIWCPRSDSVHITLMDWLAPLVDYGEDKDKLYDLLFPEYHATLGKLLVKTGVIQVRFQDVSVSKGAVFCKGTDDGQFNNIRQGFLKEHDLVPGTKLPPKIIHFSIARFMCEMDVEIAETYAKTLDLSFTETVSSFQLVRESKLPMQEYRIVHDYELS